MLLNILFPLIAKISAVKSVPTAKWKMQLDALKKTKNQKHLLLQTCCEQDTGNIVRIFGQCGIVRGNSPDPT